MDSKMYPEIDTLAKLYGLLAINTTDLNSFVNDRVSFVAQTNLSPENQRQASIDLPKMNHHFMTDNSTNIKYDGGCVSIDKVTVEARYSDGTMLLYPVVIAGTVDSVSSELKLDIVTVSKDLSPTDCSVVFSISMEPKEMEFVKHQDDQSVLVTFGPETQVYLKWMLDNPYKRQDRKAHLTGYIKADETEGTLALNFLEIEGTDDGPVPSDESPNG